MRYSILLLLFPFMVSAHTVEVFDLKDNQVRVVITDKCEVEHETIFKKEELKTDKPLKWLQKLLKEKIIDKCVK